MKKLSTLFLLTPLALSLGPFSPAVSADVPTVSVTSQTLTFTSNQPAIELESTAGVSWEIADVLGNIIQSGAVPAGATSIVPDALADGYYTLSFATGAQVPFIVATESLSTDTFYGLGSKFEKLNSLTPQGQFENRVDQHVLDVKQLGVGTMRSSISWGTFEKTPGVYSLSTLHQQWLKPMNTHGMNLYSMAIFGNEKYGAARNLDTPELKEGFKNYIIEYLNQNPQITEVEVYNEFNLAHFNTGDRSGAHYAQVLKTVYPAVKAAHPDVEIIAGATARLDRQFFQDFLAAGGGQFMDAWSYHPYGASATHLTDSVRWVQQVQAEYGVMPAKPVHISEFGWSVTGDSASTGNRARVASEELAAERLVESYVALESMRPYVQSATYYSALREGTPEQAAGDVELGFGVYDPFNAAVTQALAPTPSAFAYYNMRSELDGFVFSQMVRDDSVKVYEFVRGQEHKYVALADSAQGSVESAPVDMSALGDKWAATSSLGISYETGPVIDVAQGALFLEPVAVDAPAPVEEPSTPVTDDVVSGPVDEPSVPAVDEPIDSSETIDSTDSVEEEHPAPGDGVDLAPSVPAESVADAPSEGGSQMQQTSTAPAVEESPLAEVIEAGESDGQVPVGVVPETGLEGATVEAKTADELAGSDAAVVASAQAAPAGFSAGKVVAGAIAALGALALVAWGAVTLRNRKTKDA